jgi:hypothetical protein
MTCVLFIASLSRAALWYRKLVSAGISHDSCCVQRHDKRDIVYNVTASYRIWYEYMKQFTL